MKFIEEVDEEHLEEEFRSQNSGVRINQSGIGPATELLHHQVYDLEGVLNSFIHPTDAFILFDKIVYLDG